MLTLRKILSRPQPLTGPQNWPENAQWPPRIATTSFCGPRGFTLHGVRILFEQWLLWLKHARRFGWLQINMGVLLMLRIWQTQLFKSLIICRKIPPPIRTGGASFILQELVRQPGPVLPKQFLEI